jgi:hypothetical protein
MPYIVKALYGFGDIAVAINRDTLEVIESRHLHRPSIAKKSGIDISSQAFGVNECPEVSAVLYSSTDATNSRGQDLGNDFIVLHNDSPNVPLPLKTLRFAREYWCDDENLNITDWRAKQSKTGG